MSKVSTKTDPGRVRAGFSVFFVFLYDGQSGGV